MLIYLEGNKVVGYNPNITKEEAENLIKEMSEIDTIGVTNEKQREAMYKRQSQK